MKLSLKREARYQPRKPRSATTISTAVLLPDDRELPVQIRNMSPEGFMAITDREMPLHSWLGISIPGRGIVRAQVRWVDEFTFGAAFQSPLPVQLVEDASE